MNTVIFYTRVNFCEQSEIVTSCRDIKYCLIELLNSSFTTIDIDTNLDKIHELVRFGSEYTPWVVILDSEGGLVHAFGIIELNAMISQELPVFNTHEEYLEVLKEKMQQVLVNHGAL